MLLGDLEAGRHIQFLEEVCWPSKLLLGGELFSRGAERPESTHSNAGRCRKFWKQGAEDSTVDGVLKLIRGLDKDFSENCWEKQYSRRKTRRKISTSVLKWQERRLCLHGTEMGEDSRQRWYSSRWSGNGAKCFGQVGWQHIHCIPVVILAAHSPAMRDKWQPISE